MTFAKRIWILAILGSILLIMLVRTKWIPSIARWQENHTLLLEQGQGVSPIVELNKLQKENEALDEIIDRTSENSLWAEALELISTNTYREVSLKHINEEHVEQKDGYRISTLPVTLEGSSEDLMNLIRDFETQLPSIKIQSVRFHVSKRTHRQPRSLQSTLILRSIST